MCTLHLFEPLVNKALRVTLHTVFFIPTMVVHRVVIELLVQKLVVFPFAVGRLKLIVRNYILRRVRKSWRQREGVVAIIR